MNPDDKRYMLISIAQQYVGHNAGYRYEIDELVNEAWLDKHVKNAKSTHYVFQAGRWAMLKYMRSQQKDQKKRWKIHFTSLYDEDGYTLEPEVVPLNEVEVRDTVKWIERDLTPKQKQILQWKRDGRTFQYIAKQLGVTRQYGGCLWEQIRAIMQRQYEKELSKCYMEKN